MNKIITLTFLFFLISCSSESEPKTEELSNPYMYLSLENSDGLTTGSEIKCSGVKVGEIINIELYDLNKVLATMQLEKDFQIPINSEVILNSNLMGDVTVEITMNNSDKFLQKGDTIFSIGHEPFVPDSNLNHIHEIMGNLIETIDSTIKSGEFEIKVEIE